MDNKNSEQRSKNIAAIRSTGTKDEILLSKGLWQSGLRYLKNNKSVYGKTGLLLKNTK